VSCVRALVSLCAPRGFKGVVPLALETDAPESLAVITRSATPAAVLFLEVLQVIATTTFSWVESTTSRAANLLRNRGIL
jgi:hypothetical protein